MTCGVNMGVQGGLTATSGATDVGTVTVAWREADAVASSRGRQRVVGGEPGVAAVVVGGSGAKRGGGSSSSSSKPRVALLQGETGRWGSVSSSSICSKKTSSLNPEKAMTAAPSGLPMAEGGVWRVATTMGGW